MDVFFAIMGNEKGNFNPGGEGGSNSGGAGASSGEPGSTGGAGDVPPSSDNPGSGRTINYPEGLAEDLKGNASFDAFINSEGNLNYADMMKSYVHQKGLLGRDKIVAPNQDTTSEQWGEIYGKLGLPERTKYEVNNTMPEGMEANEKLFTGLVDVAHENGILPRQLQPVVDYFNNQLGEGVTDSNAKYDAQSAAETAALKTEWGQGYDKNLAYADAGIP